MFLINLLHFCIQPLFSLIYASLCLSTKKEGIRHWITTLFNAWNISIYRISKQKIYHSTNLIYFSNHRSWADCFVDHLTTEFSSLFIARMMVAVALPIISIVGYLVDSIYFINRNSKNIKKMFDKIWIDTRNNKYNNILVYPEGTRRYDALNPCDLKKGFIYYAFDHDIDIQFIITKNKEKVLNERKFKISYNENLYVYYSKVINVKKIKHNLKQYNDDEQKQHFYQIINNKWKKDWNIVYSQKNNTKLIKPQKIDINKIWNNKNNIPLTYRLYTYGFILFFTMMLIYLIIF